MLRMARLRKEFGLLRYFKYQKVVSVCDSTSTGEEGKCPKPRLRYFTDRKTPRFVVFFGCLSSDVFPGFRPYIYKTLECRKCVYTVHKSVQL